MTDINTDDVNCAELMKEILEALKEWGVENFELFSLDVAAECKDEWSADYAIIEFDLAVAGDGRYIDIERAQSDIFDIVLTKLAGRFAEAKPRGRRSSGVLYYALHEREIEIFRYNGTEAA